MKNQKSMQHVRYECDTCQMKKFALFYDASIGDLFTHSQCGGLWHKLENRDSEPISDEAAFINLVSRLYFYARIKTQEVNPLLEAPKNPFWEFAYNVQSLLEHLSKRLRCLLAAEEILGLIEKDAGVEFFGQFIIEGSLAYWETFLSDLEKSSMVKVNKNLKEDHYLVNLETAVEGESK